MPARYAHRAAATAGLALIAVASPSASTCFVPPLETSVSGATLIFRGTVAKVDYFARDAGDRVPAAQGSLCGPKLVTYTIDEMLKGATAADVTVFAEDGCIGLGNYYRDGDEVIEFAYAETAALARSVTSRSGRTQQPPPGMLTVHACGGTRHVRSEGTRSRVNADEYLRQIRDLLGRSAQQ